MATNGGSDAQAVGQGDYEVQPGDCMESVAFTRGFLWQTLWNLSENAELKQKRQPNLLLAGDRITIPPIRVRNESCATDQNHKFVLQMVKSKFRLRFLDDRQKPRNGVPYKLTIDGKATSGSLDSTGGLSVPIQPDAVHGTIELQVDPEPETYQLDFGHLDPDTALTGLRGRLNNLGFSCAGDGDWDQGLEAALSKFQQANDLPASGALDDPTKQKLKELHLS